MDRSNLLLRFPQLFESQLINKFTITTVEVSLLYSVSSAPNLVSNLIAAWLIEKIGLGISALLFSTQVFIGIFICFYGITNGQFKLLLIGRFIFGIGFDTTFLAQTLAAERWFSGRFMTLAISLNRSCVYLFAAISTYLQPELFFKYRGFEVPLFAYALVAVMCFLSTAMFTMIHIKKEHILEDKQTKNAMKSKFSWKDFKHLDFMPWMIAINLALISNCYYQVMNFSTDMIVNRYGLEYVEAKNAGTLIPIVSMILIPIFGFMFNKYGKKGLGMMISAILAVITFGTMSVIPLGCDKSFVYYFLIMIAVFRSIYTSCVWSCLVLSVPKQASTAFVAFGATLQNICMASFPPLFAKLNYQRNSASYQKSIYFLIGMSIVSFCLSFVINLVDLRTDKILFLPENDDVVAELKIKKSMNLVRRRELMT